jgi:enoyl-CoA hydratase
MSTYRHQDGAAYIDLDDGKVNALGKSAITDLNEQFDRALSDEAAAVLISGRQGVFSAGFNLKELQSGPTASMELRKQLIALELRMLEFELPIVIACTGHALAAGAALLLAADRRIGLDGPFKLGFNEASIGASISGATVELARYRMPMPWFESLIFGETFSPHSAQLAGLLDEVVDGAERLAEASQAAVNVVRQVPLPVFREIRMAAREHTIDRIRHELSLLST